MKIKNSLHLAMMFQKAMLYSGFLMAYYYDGTEVQFFYKDYGMWIKYQVAWDQYSE